MKSSDKNVHDRYCQFHINGDKLHSSAYNKKNVSHCKGKQIVGMGQGGRTSLQAESPALPPTDHPKKTNETGPKVRHKQDHGGSTHNGPHLWYTEEPVPGVSMTYIKSIIFQYEIIHMPTLGEDLRTRVNHSRVS